MADWEERVRVAAQRAKKQAERAAPIAKRRAEQAGTVAQEQAVRGKAVVERRLAERQAEAEERRRWYLTESGPVYTAGYPDEAAMRAGIQAASEHGWRVESTATVPERRVPLLGFTATLANQALNRVLERDRFLVTFRKTETESPGPPTPASPPG